MRRRFSRFWAFVLATVVLAAVAIGGYGLYIAGEAGTLPWQEEPTRIAVTPFADIPGFGVTPTAEASPEAADREGDPISRWGETGSTTRRDMGSEDG